MSSFLLRVLINSIAIAATAWLLPGIEVGGNKLLTVVLVAVIFALVNSIIKPIFSFFTCGLYVVSLGLFTFIVNALMLLATSRIAEWFGLQFAINGFWTAVLGSIIISIVSILLSLTLGGRKRAYHEE